MPKGVSIPAGFSDALRHGISVKDSPEHQYVSIPAGFSDALRLGPILYVLSPSFMFQSLLGFLMRCDHSIPS